MAFVLDASIALAWCFDDEATPETTALLDRLTTEVAYVPELWSLELGNILIGALKRKRITPAKVAEFFAMLDIINIRIDKETANRGFHEIFSLAQSQSLTTYDAAYLELAMRLGLPLATKDIALRNAAILLGVSVLV